MRDWLATTLNADPGLRDLGLPVDRVFQADATEDPGKPPFIIIRWTERQGGFRRAPSQPNLVDIWCYDHRGDFTRIDAFIGRIKAILDPVSAVKTSTGAITQCDWVADGSDNYDDVWKAIVRTVTYRVIASYVPS